MRAAESDAAQALSINFEESRVEEVRERRAGNQAIQGVRDWADWGFVCVADVVNSGANTLISQRSQ